jgi:S-adenosylmethionine synthetase
MNNQRILNCGVEHQKPMNRGADDQIMMSDYASKETDTSMPLILYLSCNVLVKLAKIRKGNKGMINQDPDATQVTIEYDDSYCSRESMRILQDIFFFF